MKSTSARTRRKARGETARFLLRIDASLHAGLREAARGAGLSLNEYCARRLAAPVGGPGAGPDASAVVASAAALFGTDLIGVVAFGSWSRGELADSSDVDLLVV